MSNDEPLTVYVYGHYDSRGGTTAIAAESKERADEVYNNEVFGLKSMLEDYRRNPTSWTWNPETETENWPSNADFLYVAQLHNAPDGSEIDLENGGMCDEVGGEVWISSQDWAFPELEFTQPSDQIMRLLWVPVECYEGMPHRVARGWSAAAGAGDLALGMPEGGGVVVEGDTATLYYTEPKSMIRCTVDGVVYDFDSDTDGRAPGWTHPRWDDDAFAFILMRR